MKTTYLIIVLNVLVYAAMMATSHEVGEFSTRTLIDFGALYVPLVREGQWWRIFTMMFIHLTPAHIIMNMIAMVQVGLVLEGHFGRMRYVLLYLMAGLGGSLVSLAWHAFMGVSVSAGASGAISGLIGAAVVVGHLRGGAEGRRFRDQMLIWMAIVAVFGIVFGADNAAHAGGFLFGALMAWTFDRGGNNLRRRVSDKGIGLEALILVAVVGGGMALAARQRNMDMKLGDLINSGVEAAKAGDDDKAMSKYREAITVDPKDPIAHFNLALALHRKEKLPEAEQEVRKALALDPQLKNGWLILSEILEANGKRDESKTAMDKFKALGGVVPPPESTDGG
jgi:rhomboid protease GluP